MFNDLGYPIGEDFSHSNGKNSHFHDAPLESVTPLLDISGEWTVQRGCWL
jgi:hypothetical protein